MHLSAVDILILVPLVPALPLVVVWYLPWEKWVWERLPKQLRLFAGPYVLYASFVLWHFGCAWWAVLIGVAAGIGWSVWAVSQFSVGRRNGAKQMQDSTPPATREKKL